MLFIAFMSFLQLASGTLSSHTENTDAQRSITVGLFAAIFPSSTPLFGSNSAPKSFHASGLLAQAADN